MKARSFVARLIAVCAVIALLAAGLPTAVAAQATPEADVARPLDLAALAIMPSDVPDDTYLIFDGISCLSAESCADGRFFIAPEETLREAGMTRGFGQVLITVNPETPYETPRGISTIIAEFENEAGAEAGLEILSDGDPDSEPTLEPIGDESFSFEADGEIPEDPIATGASAVRFRLGNLAIAIDLREYADGDPTAAQAEALARLVADRIAAQSDDAGDSPALAALALHFVPRSQDYYDLIDGTVQHGVVDDDTGPAVLDLDPDEYGLSARYITSQTLLEDFNLPYPPLTFASRLFQLDDAKAAATFYEQYLSELTAKYDADGIPYEVTKKAPNLGEEAIAIAVGAADNRGIAQVIVRTGTVVVDVRWISTSANPDGRDAQLAYAQDALMRGARWSANKQVACVEKSSCAGVTTVQSKLLPGGS